MLDTFRRFLCRSPVSASRQAGLPWHLLRCCALGWAWLALLWAGSHWLTDLAPWMWLAIAMALTLLPAWGLWLHFMLRKKLLRFQFAPQGHIGRWLAGGIWPGCKAVVIALALCIGCLCQAWFLAPWEWALLALAVPLQALLVWGWQRQLVAEFSAPGFAWVWAQRLAQWLLLVLLGGLWLYLMLRQHDLGRAIGPSVQPQALDAMLARLEQAPSGVVRWALDALLSLQVAGAAVADLPHTPWLRTLLLALFGPVGVLLSLCCALRGAGATRAIALQAMPDGGRELHTAQPPLQRSQRAMVWVVIAVLLSAIVLQSTAALDGWLRSQPSPLALQRLPECERIGRQLYRIGTLERTRAQALDTLAQLGQHPSLCQGLGAARAEADAAIERYLDWYFSLGAEWGRIFSLLTGDVNEFLQQRLVQTLGTSPGLNHWMQAMQQQAGQERAVLQSGQQRIRETLERHHLALDEGQCRLTVQVPELPAIGLLGNVQQRLSLSATVGGGAAALAGVVAGKAMAKASMKAAGKVLAKAAAKQGMGKAGGAVAGAALGSLLPGLGTAAGAIAGAVAGVAIGAGIDWAALYAEELLTRDAMRADLRAVLYEQMDAVAHALRCPTGPLVP